MGCVHKSAKMRGFLFLFLVFQSSSVPPFPQQELTEHLLYVRTAVGTETNTTNKINTGP